MKRFSNINEIEKIKSSKIENTINKMLKENLNVTLIGENYVGKNITIGGQSDFILEMGKLIDESKIETMILNETVSSRFIDQNILNSTLEKLYEMYDIISLVPSPEDIFSSEDYEHINDTIVLKSLNNMPEDYLDFVNSEYAGNYFQDGNTIRISYSDDNTWRLYFIPNTTNDYREFVEINKEFISDFVKSTEKLIGHKNLIIDQKLLNLAK